MIVGLGLDLVDIEAFRRQLDDPATTFVTGTFTPAERRSSRAKPSRDPARHLAARFAAKEAFVKAWSVANAGRAPVVARADLQEIEVVQDAWGRPSLRLHGLIGADLESRGWRSMLSISHDGGMAAAVVVLDDSSPSSSDP